MYDGIEWMTLVSSTPNTGSCIVNVPTYYTDITNAQIKLFLASNIDIESASDNFTIYKTTQSITITSPNSNTTWQAGTEQTIQWNSEGISTSSNVYIEFYNGSEWINLISSTPNTGSVSVNIPESNVSVTNAVILVRLFSNPDILGQSDPFTVEGITQSISVISPDNNSQWNYNTNKIISWESENIGMNEYVRIKLFDGSTWRTLTSSTNNDGSFETSVPLINYSTSDALVSIMLVSNNNIYGESNYFSVFKPTSYLDIAIDQTGVEDCITSIESTFPDGVIEVFPNPNNGIFTISLNEGNYVDDIKVNIIDESGKFIYSDSFCQNIGEHTKTIDLSGKKGVFIITLQGSEYKYSCKVIIK